MIVRPADAGDVAAILELYAELGELHRRKHPELYNSPVPARTVEWLEGQLREPGVAFLVTDTGAASAPNVVGFAQLVETHTPQGLPLRARRFCLLDALAVREAFRRRGAAKALLAAAEMWARERGLESLEVTVWSFNAGALELYERDGFEPLRQYWRKPL
jgi:ribosomal protein S18 acetylase RimI-like enzyme